MSNSFLFLNYVVFLLLKISPLLVIIFFKINWSPFKLRATKAHIPCLNMSSDLRTKIRNLLEGQAFRPFTRSLEISNEHSVIQISFFFPVICTTNYQF
jgi:hypothetical protein